MFSIYTARVSTILSNFLLTAKPPFISFHFKFRVPPPIMAALPKRRSCFIYDDDDDYEFQLSRSPIWFNNRSSPSRIYFYETRSDRRQPHFLDSCYLCRKSLAGDNDIFMYRGDTPFCSEECRAEQIDMDEAKEKHRNVSSVIRAGVEKSLNSSNKVESYSFRTGTIAAA